MGSRVHLMMKIRVESFLHMILKEKGIDLNDCFIIECSVILGRNP